MNTTFITYSIYLVISIGMTIWVARTLHSNGRVFLVEALSDNEALADSVNHLLVVGFYLVNLGFVSLHLKSDVEVFTATAGLELLSKKVGTVLLTLGAMHFFNIWVFNRWRRKEKLRSAPPPVAPTGYLFAPQTYAHAGYGAGHASAYYGQHVNTSPAQQPAQQTQGVGHPTNAVNNTTPNQTPTPQGRPPHQGG